MDNQETRINTLHNFYQAPDESLHPQATITAVLDCSEAKLERDRWVGVGIPFIKIGRSVKYRKTDVMEWLSQHKPQQSTSKTKNQAA